MTLKLSKRIIRLLNDDYRKSEGIALAQSWIDAQQTKIDVRSSALNQTTSELSEIRTYVQMFVE